MSIDCIGRGSVFGYVLDRLSAMASADQYTDINRTFGMRVASAVPKLKLSPMRVIVLRRGIFKMNIRRLDSAGQKESACNYLVLDTEAGTGGFASFSTRNIKMESTQRKPAFGAWRRTTSTYGIEKKVVSFGKEKVRAAQHRAPTSRVSYVVPK